MEKSVDFSQIKKDIFTNVLELKTAVGFFDLTTELIKKINEHKQDVEISFCIDFFERVFENPNFIESMNKALGNRMVSDKLIAQTLEQKRRIRNENSEEKKLIVAALTLSVTPLIILLEKFNKDEIRMFKKKIRKSLFKLQNSLNDFFYVSRIVNFFSEVLFFEYLYRVNPSQFIPNFREISEKLIQIKLVLQVIFMQSIKIENLSDKTKGMVYQLEQGKKFRTYFLKKIYNSIIFQNDSLNYLRQKIISTSDGSAIFRSILDGFYYQNEENTYEFIYEIANHFSVINSEMWESDIAAFIKDSPEIFKRLEDIASKKLTAFHGVVIDEREWSNKIYIVSQKLVGIAKSIKLASDPNWKMLVMRREFEIWLNEINSILNIQDLEDDWDEIKDHIQQENELSEWKSTFYTPTEALDGEISIKNASPYLLKGISEAILGMINAGGGTILVGVVEGVSKIKSQKILENVFWKRGIYFFDTGTEIKKINKTLDEIKRNIQDMLTSETKKGAELFNELWDIVPIQIKTHQKSIYIHKITVRKSDTAIHSVLEKDGGVWLCLRKRADGRTKLVDFREHL